MKKWQRTKWKSAKANDLNSGNVESGKYRDFGSGKVESGESKGLVSANMESGRSRGLGHRTNGKLKAENSEF